MFRKPYFLFAIVVTILLYFIYSFFKADDNSLREDPSSIPVTKEQQIVQIVLPEKSRVLIFCLHNISPKGRYSISEQELVAFLEQLKNEFVVLSLRDWYKKYRQGDSFEKPPVVLTFDDGYPSHLKIVAPLLKKYNFGATFFIYTKLNKDSSVFYKKLAALEPQFEIGGHSYSHADLKKMNVEDRNEFYHELYLSRKKLEYLTNKKVNSFAWPFGYYNEEVVAVAKHAGYILQVSTDGVIASIKKDSALLPRVTVQQPAPVQQTEKILTRYKDLFYADKKVDKNSSANSARSQRPLPR